MQTYDDMSHELARLVVSQLRMPDAELSVLARKVGRRVPRRIRRDLVRVADAAQMGHHPKLAARVDANAVKTSFHRAAHWLNAFDVQAHRAQARRRLWAGLALRLMLIVIAAIAVMAWLGLIGPGAV